MSGEGVSLRTSLAWSQNPLKTALLSKQAGIPRLNLFLALSRTPHLLLDLATPGLAALLCLGAFPPFGVTVLGLITVFAGYTAVYALNDVVDHRRDKEKLQRVRSLDTENDLDVTSVRHPIAQDMLE